MIVYPQFYIHFDHSGSKQLAVTFAVLYVCVPTFEIMGRDFKFFTVILSSKLMVVYNLAGLGTVLISL